MDKPVAVVILNWNGYDDTERCLRTVLASDYRAAYPIVVDNASTDGSFERLSEAFPEVAVLPAGGNIGYAAGNNVGIRRALELGAEYVYVINNDTEVPADSVGLLVEAMEADARIGQVGPKVDDATIDRIGAVGGEVFWPLAEPRQIGHGEVDRGQYAAIREVEYVPGTAVMARRAALEEVGLIPEHYFIYFEDVHWSLRFRDAGWKTVVEPRASIVHWESSTMGRQSPIKTYYQVRNNLTFLEECVSREERRAVNLRLHAKLAKSAAKHLASRSLPQLRAMVAGYADFRAGRMGKTERRF